MDQADCRIHRTGHLLFFSQQLDLFVNHQGIQSHTGIEVVATRTLSLDVSVGQECIVVLAEGLSRCPLLEIAIIPDLLEHVLHYFGVFLRCGATEIVE